jgi:quercetin dioxygenase-like cupin family protein
MTNGKSMKIINSVDVNKDLEYEPPYTILWGVNDETTDTTVMTMARTIIPPGGKNKMHYHSCDATFYVARGPIYVYSGDPKNPDRQLVEAGNFCYAPAGVIHGQENPSKTEVAELIATYGNCSHRDKAETVFVQ